MTTTTQVPLRRVTGMIRRTWSRPAPISRAAYAIRERRAQRDHAFDIAATLELHLKSYPTKNAMLALLHTWLYAAEQQELITRRPDYVHGVRYALGVMADAVSPEDAIELLRETEPNVRFIVAPAQSANAKTPTSAYKERFVFERKGRYWTWKCVSQDSQTVRTAERSFTYYLDCYVDAKLHGFSGTPFLVVPSGDMVSRPTAGRRTYRVPAK